MSVRRLVAGPAAEVVTIAEQKAHSSIDSTETEGLLAGFLIGARQSIERMCRLALLDQTWDLLIDDGWPLEWDPGPCIYRVRIDLELAPVKSITSITYVDPAGAPQVLATNQYQLSRANVENRSGRVSQAFGVAWPTVRPQPECITVRFVAGYGTNPGDVPEPIREAIRLLAAHFHENREQVAVISGSFADLPFGVHALLADFVVGGNPDSLGG